MEHFLLKACTFAGSCHGGCVAFFYKPLVLLSCNVNKNQLHVLELIFMIKNYQNILNSQACIFIIASFGKCTRAILLTWLRRRP